MKCTGASATRYPLATIIVLLLTTICATLAISQGVPKPRRTVRMVSPGQKTVAPRFVVLRRPVRKRFGKPSDVPVVAVRSTFAGKSGKITIVGNLGRAFSDSFESGVEAANGRSFSRVSWERLKENALPAGVIVRPTGRVAQPEIPSIDVTIAIPETATNIKAAFAATVTQSLSNTLLPPVATHVGTTIGSRVYDAQQYGAVQPSDNVTISRTAHFRRVRFATFTIPLASVGKSVGEIVAKNSFTVNVSFDVAAVPVANTAATIDPVFDAAYRAMVANPQDIASFALPFHPKRQRSTQQSLAKVITADSNLVSWIEPSAPYVKLTVSRTGLYRAQIDELITRSGNNSIASWSPSSIRLINKGKEVPIWIDSTGGKFNAMEFYGERNPGFKSEYFSWETDSNAYFLTTSSRTGGTPLRFDEPVGLNPTSTIDRGILTLHHERDLDYYGGDEVADQSTTLHRYGWIPGERFVWKVMKQNDSAVDDTFILPTLGADTAGKFASLTIFVRGASSIQSGVLTHTCRVVVNSVVLRDETFNDYNEDRFQIPVPLGVLRSGANTVSIILPSKSNDVWWYFDYAELSLPSALEPSSDTAVVNGQWRYSINAAANDLTLRLQSQIGIPELFDLDNRKRIVASSSVGSTVDFRLRGTGAVIDLAAATPATFLHPDQIVDVGPRWNAILDTASGTDYIVITYPGFKRAAEALALRRNSVDGLRTKVVTTDDIFNAFGFGSNVPEALQHYLQYAYDYYPGTPPSFVTLMGDGTWDPKMTLPSTIHQDFVPTFGVPSSDYYFTADQGIGFPDSVVSNMVIGRISVETADQADDAVRKIIDYESQPPADWNRAFDFIVGGSDPLQHAILHDYAFHWYNEAQYGGLILPPTNARGSFIDRVDFSSVLDGTLVSVIQSKFQEGIAFLTFFGHGAPNITDVLFPDVGTLRNQSTYPVFLTLSCRTGAFAEPNLISLNESFLRSANSGVIMTFGTTGYGEIDYDFNMTARIFQLMRSDTAVARRPLTGAHVINMPIVFTVSKLIQSIASANVGLQFGQDNSLFEYTVLGDAALGFSFRPQAEFHVASEDVHLFGPKGDERSTFSVFDSTIHIRAQLRNFGYSAPGPVVVSVTDVFGGGAVTIRDTIVRFDTLAAIDEVLKLDTSLIGAHTLHIYVDSLNQYAETNEKDNEAIVSFLVSGAYTLPFYPPEGAKQMCDITSDSVRLSLLAPSRDNMLSVDIQVDTTSSFTHPVTLVSLPIDAHVFYSKVFPRTVFPRTLSGVIWWRTQTHTRNGKDEVSDVSSFSLLQSAGRSSFSYSTPDQLARTIVSGLVIDPSSGGLTLPVNEQLRYDVEARSSSDTNIDIFPIGQVFVNEQEIYRTPFSGGNDFNGVVLLRLSRDGERVDTAYEFANTGGSVSDGEALADTFARVVVSIATGTPVIVMTNFQPFIPGFTTNPVVTSALQSLGSANGMTTLQYFGSYGLIGKKGLDSGQAHELTNPGGKDGTHLFDTVMITRRSGTARFPLTAAATGYGAARWVASHAASGARVTITILGSEKRTGTLDTVRVIDGLATSQNDLSSIDPLKHDRLQALLEIVRDSVTLESPVFTSLDLEYEFAPEYLLDATTATITPATIMEGLNAVAKYSCSNLTCVDGINVPVVLTRTFNGRTDTVGRHTIAQLAGHSTLTLSDTVGTFGFLGNVAYTATINPDQLRNEQISFNNAATLDLNVVRDSLKPTIDVLFDEHHINSEDYVGTKVTINARLIDANPVRASDSGAVGMMLIQTKPSSTSPWIFKGGKVTSGFTTTFATLPSGSIQATLQTTRDSGLAPGTYDLSAWGIDASGNKTDTFDVEFNVASKNSLQEVMNYPNPFKDKTWFTYRLTASGQSDVKVVIYTIAGRKIRTLTQGPANQRVGINAIEWDGRDESGNEIGNGTYLYKLILSGTNEDGTSVSQSILERAVKSR